MTPARWTKQDVYTPRPEHHFTFWLWTDRNSRRDPFAAPSRAAMSAVEIGGKLAELGACGVNFHDDNLVPRGSSTAERDRIVREFRKALDATGMKVPRRTTN